MVENNINLFLMNKYGCFQKYWYPKMDGENVMVPNPMNKWMIWVGFPPIFGNTHIYLYHPKNIMAQVAIANKISRLTAES